MLIALIWYSAVSAAFQPSSKPASKTFDMRFTLSFTIVAALCVLRCAFAMPTKVKMSETEVKAKRDDGVAPSSRLRQTSWREIQERQEMRNSPLYKRQQPSAVVRRRSVAFPDCPVIQGNFSLRGTRRRISPLL